MLHFDILKPREWVGKETDGQILIAPVSAESHLRPHIVAHVQWCSALSLVHPASVSPLRGGVRLEGLWHVCVHVHLTPHLQHPAVRVLAMATMPVGSCSNLGSLMRAVSLKPHLGCFCFAHVTGRKCSYVTFLFAGCRKFVCTLSIKIQSSIFLKKKLICFRRTWLEQKPVQCRSLRTGVENHYA